jgi:hypothetical protein
VAVGGRAVSTAGEANASAGGAQGGTSSGDGGVGTGAGASAGGAAGASGAQTMGGANAGGSAGLDPGTGPLKELTLDTAKQLYFEHLAAGYKFVEAKGVNSGLPGRYSRWVKGQDPEFITRNMEAMGAWLSQPARPTLVTTSRGTLDIEEMMRKALANGTDPASGVTWETLDKGQLDVESGSISWGTFLAGARVLSKLTPAQSTNLQSWLLNHTAGVVDQNWNLFYIVTNSLLKNQGWKSNPAALTTDLAKIESYYKGDGWYTDGATHVFDEYNNTVFVPDTIAWSVLTGSDNPTQRSAMMMRVRTFLQDQPYFFGTGGMHPEFGRSTAYKTARLTGLLIAYYIDRTYNTPDKWNLGFKVLPESFTPGMLRRLVRQQLNYYFTNALDPATGLLVQAATLAGSVDIAEDYISPGSVSWAVRAFGPLFLLADDDPFWSTPEEALPIEKGNYNQWLPTPGLLLSGTQSTGNVVLFNAGSTFSTAHTDSYILKYGKFAYSSQLGFAVANDSTTWRNPDNAIQIGVGTAWGHREEPGIFASQSNTPDTAVLSMKHRQTVGGGNFDVRTIIFVKDEFHVRVNKVTPVGFTGTYQLREGGFAIGRSAANSGMAMQDATKIWSYDTGAEGAGMVAALKTYNDVQTDLPAAEKREGAATPGAFNSGTAHTRYQYYALPYVRTSGAQTGEQTVALLVRGSKVPFDPAATYATVKSLVVDASKATITFADGSSLVGTFLN